MRRSRTAVPVGWPTCGAGAGRQYFFPVERGTRAPVGPGKRRGQS